MTKTQAVAPFTLLLLLTACSSGGGPDPFEGAASELCDEIVGLEAIYWDFVNGVPRGDLPSTAFTIPFPFGGTYSNSTSLLLGFTVPQGWTATDAVDASGFAIPGTFAGADVVRADGQAIWRYVLNAQVGGYYTSEAIMEADVAEVMDQVGTPPEDVSQCGFNVQREGILGFESAAGKIVRAGDFTIMGRAQVNIVKGIGGFYNGFVSIAPTAENEALIEDIYVPMITQLYGGGGTELAACEDGEDNDGDGQIDFPNDPDCGNAADDDESS